MANVNLSKRSVGVGFEYSETIADGANGDTVLLPGISDSERVTCTIIAGANTGKFQFTTSSDAAVLADTCTWIDWPKGTVTGTEYDLLLGPVTAVRGVSVSGEINIEIVR
jgi:hypothetical protein